MQILEQLERLGVKANNLCADSRAVAAGDVFVAYPGARADGRRFIADAVARQAAAVLWEKRGHAWDGALKAPNLPV
ncbi:MAG: UDP-N-acetylmuramoyl-L-alanyl-D-glutamate--2,6-diaminopimelate ligase, partial [Rhodocyclaceae bacterium]|nr:UDP-N-acetylmuramoyl-L-alanyl-D-glutamate--2,6-diaminopimelate ligase [Rhodocyclaceae bacterium]